MGLMDSIFGSEPDMEYKQSKGQKQLQRMLLPMFKGLFGEGGWQNLLPTEQMMGSLSPEVWAGANYQINRGADMLQERLGGMGFTGGSGMAGMADYFANATPQVYGNLANQVMGAAQYPYQAGTNLWGSTLASPVVTPGSPGIMQSLLPMATSFGMSHLPWGDFGGLMGS